MNPSFVTDTRTSTSPEQTLAMGATMGHYLVGGLTIGLVGPLGAGKTQLVKGIAAGNAQDDGCEVTSPTFTLVNEYMGRLKIYHIDAYRLADGDALTALGFDEFMTDGSVVLVEWADKVRSAMPDDTLWIELSPTGQATRALTLRACGPPANTYLNRLQAMI